MATERGGTTRHLHEVLDGLGPRQAVQALEHEFPGWHVFESRDGQRPTGHLWAVTVHCPTNASGGITVGPEASAEGLWREIAAEEHRWGKAWVAA